MTEHELPKLHPNTDYIHKAIKSGPIFGKDDTVTKRVDVLEEGVRIPDGRIVEIGALVCEDDSLTVCWMGHYNNVVGTARNMERDPETNKISFDVTIPANIGFDMMDLMDFAAYADSLVTENTDDGGKIVWARIRAINIIPIPGIPRDMLKEKKQDG